MRPVVWWAAAALGVVVAVAIAVAPLTWPALAVAGGAVATAVAHVAGDARRRYALAGTAYCLGFAAVAWLGPVPVADPESTTLALASVGAASAVVVAALLATRRVVRSVTTSPTLAVRSLPSIARRVVRVGAALRSAFALGSAVRLVALAAVGVGVTLLVGFATFVLNGLGVRAPIPWFVGDEVDAVLLAFVASVVVGFHVLGVLDATVRAARMGVESGRTVGSRVTAMIRRAREELEEEP